MLDGTASVVLLACGNDQVEVEVISVPVVLVGYEKVQLEVEVVTVPTGLELVEGT